MTSKGLTDLIFVKGTVDGPKYVEEILPILISVQERKRKTKEVMPTMPAKKSRPQNSNRQSNFNIIRRS